LGPDGTVGVPGLAFGNDTDTGFWRPASNRLDISCGGVSVACFGASSIVDWIIGAHTTTSVGLAGGATALPATPLGYWIIQINGVNCRIPYYNA
jgi:hypothetical protein